MQELSDRREVSCIGPRCHVTTGFFVAPRREWSSTVRSKKRGENSGKNILLSREENAINAKFRQDLVNKELPPINIHHFPNVIEILTFVRYDATVDGEDSQQPENQHNRDSHSDATPTHSARVFGVVCVFRELESEIDEFPSVSLSRLGTAMRWILTDTTARARMQKARPPTGARIRTVRDFIRRPRIRLTNEILCVLPAPDT